MMEITETIYTEELYQLPAGVVVILDKEWKDVSQDEQTLLGKILASVKQNLNGIRIICNKKIEVKEFMSGAKVISFGVALNPEIPSYQLTILNGSTFIQADSLLQLDDAKKKSLWGEMKIAFGR